MKQKRNKRLNDILAEFRNFGNMASINEDLILRHQRKLTGTEPSNDAFTVRLCAIFSDDADPLQTWSSLFAGLFGAYVQ